MNRRISFYVFSAVFCFASWAGPSSGGDGYRYWYDQTYGYRCLGVLHGYDGSKVVLKASDGKTLSPIGLDRLSDADVEFVRACKRAEGAAAALARSPYTTSVKELAALRDKLLANHVSEEFAAGTTDPRYVFTSLPFPPFLDRTVVTGDRRLADVRAPRWIKFRGLEWEVASSTPRDDLTGLDVIVVNSRDGVQREVPADVGMISLLPSFWRGATFRPKLGGAGENPFQARGPPSGTTVLPDAQWKYELEFDPVSSVWTDKESAKAHRLIRSAEGGWEEARRLAVIAEARWRVNQGDRLCENRLVQTAFDEYNEAAKLFPRYPDPYVRLGCIHAIVGDNDLAVADLGRAIELGWTKRSVLLPSLEMRGRVYSNMALAERDDTRLAIRHHDSAVADSRRMVAYNTRSLPEEPIAPLAVTFLSQWNPNFGEGRSTEVLFELRTVAASDVSGRAKTAAEDAQRLNATASTAVDDVRRDLGIPSNDVAKGSGVAIETLRAAVIKVESVVFEIETAIELGNESVNLQRRAVDFNPNPTRARTFEGALAAYTDAGRTSTHLRSLAPTTASVVRAQLKLRDAESRFGASQGVVSEYCKYRRADTAQWSSEKFIEVDRELRETLTDTTSAIEMLADARGFAHKAIVHNPNQEDDAYFRAVLSKINERDVEYQDRRTRTSATISILRAFEYAMNARRLKDQATGSLEKYTPPNTENWGESQFSVAIGDLKAVFRVQEDAVLLVDRAIMSVDRAIAYNNQTSDPSVGAFYAEERKTLVGERAQYNVPYKNAWTILGEHEERFSSYLLAKREFLRALRYAGDAAQHNPESSAKSSNRSPNLILQDTHDYIASAELAIKNGDFEKATLDAREAFKVAPAEVKELARKALETAITYSLSTSTLFQHLRSF